MEAFIWDSTCRKPEPAQSVRRPHAGTTNWLNTTTGRVPAVRGNGEHLYDFGPTSDLYRIAPDPSGAGELLSRTRARQASDELALYGLPRCRRTRVMGRGGVAAPVPQSRRGGSALGREAASQRTQLQREMRTMCQSIAPLDVNNINMFVTNYGTSRTTSRTTATPAVFHEGTIRRRVQSAGLGGKVNGKCVRRSAVTDKYSRAP